MYKMLIDHKKMVGVVFMKKEGDEVKIGRVYLFR